MTWFGIKCLFRTAIKGSSSAVGDLAACEERIILVAATSFKTAIATGEKEAIKYAASIQWMNKDGRRVITTYIGACDAFRLSEAPANKVEIYSKFFFVPQETSNAALADRFLGTTNEQPSARSRDFEPDFERLLHDRQRAGRSRKATAKHRTSVSVVKGRRKREPR